MPKFQVNFMIKDWVQVMVDAINEESARKEAEQKLHKLYSVKSGIDCVDGVTTYLGCLNESEIDID